MSSGLLAFIAGLGTGYVRESKYQDEKTRQEKLDQITFDEAADKAAERQRKLKGDQALSEAGADVAPTDGASVTGIAANPTVYDDASVAASDARQSRQMAEKTGQQAPNVTVTPAATVDGTAYPDASSAQAAATAANNPAARRARQIARLGTIDPERAARLEQETTTTQAAQLKLDAAKQDAADKVWQRSVGAALSSADPHAGLADLINKTEVGVMQGRQVKPVVSDDGKSVTYNLVAPDGTMKPTNLTFSNDMNGAVQAAYLLDRTVTPEHRLEFALKSKEADAKMAAQAAQAGYWTAAANKQQALADNGGAAPKQTRADHFDEKQWDAAGKIDKDLVSIPDPLGGEKPTQSGDLRSQRMQLFNALRTSGELSPQEAAERADTAIVNIKNAALQMVADAHAQDKNATLTIDQAIKQVIVRAKQAARVKELTSKPQAEPGSAPGVRIPAGEQAARDRDALAAVSTELKAAQGRLAALPPNADPDVLRRAQEDVAGLTKEVARLQKTSARSGVKAPAAPAAAPPAARVAAAGVKPAVNAAANPYLNESNYSIDDLNRLSMQGTKDPRLDEAIRVRLEQIRQRDTPGTDPLAGNVILSSQGL